MVRDRLGQKPLFYSYSDSKIIFGSNLKSLIFNSRNVNFPINIKLIVSNNPKAPGLLYAKKYSIPFLIINTKRRDYENIIFKSTMVVSKNFKKNK